MNYVERLKDRLGKVGQVYTATQATESAPARPLPVEDVQQIPVCNQLVDVMIACRIKGIEFDELVGIAEQWAEYEWTLAEPLIAAARATTQDARAAA